MTLMFFASLTAVHLVVMAMSTAGIRVIDMATTRFSPVRMRILIAAESYAPAVNGVANSVARVEQHLRFRGHEVLVIAPSPGPSDAGVIRTPSRSLPCYRDLPVGLPSTAAVQEAIDRFQPDVVHLAAPVALGARVATIAARRQLPIVAVFQTDYAGFATTYGLGGASAGLWWWLRRIHRLADVNLAPSTATAAMLKANGIPRVGLWGRGVDLDLFTPERRSQIFRDRVFCGYSPRDRTPAIVGYMGRLSREKRVDRLHLVDGWRDVAVVIVGDGPARPEFEAALPNAHFTGMLRGADLATALASFDLFVHTGEHETFCQSIQEAMACALPVIAPARGGPLDLVEDGKTGLLVQPDDGFEGPVRALVDNPERRTDMGRAGRARTEGRTWSAIGDQLIEVYERCAASRIAGLTRSNARQLVTVGRS